jgi:hypothetical protein
MQTLRRITTALVLALVVAGSTAGCLLVPFPVGGGGHDHGHRHGHRW